MTGRAAVVLASLAVSVVAAELLAGAVHRFAFPLLNVFVADLEYGVRLSPHAHTRTRSPLGRITPITLNAEGFRGDDWTAASAAVAPRGVLLLGDSQMFGYGVDLGYATATRLGALIDAPVFNAAVPTWGPLEYVAVARAQVPKVRPRAVLFVANLANDWLEVAVPNTRRTSALDGWAVRAGPRLESSTSGAFTTWLYGRSHLVYALRRASATLREPDAVSSSMLTALAERSRRPRAAGPARSPLTSAVRDLSELCAASSCDVVVATLPVDVMVDAAEWRKYRGARAALSAATTLSEDLLADAHDLGLATVDLLPPLRAASPGMFLPDDYHLSEAGHAVVADALAAALPGAATAAAVPRVERGAP